MNTHQEEYESMLYQLGHISAEISHLLAFLDQQEVNPSVIENVQSQVFLSDRTIIDKLGVAERSIRDIRAMVEQWVAVATPRLQ